MNISYHTHNIHCDHKSPAKIVRGNVTISRMRKTYILIFSNNRMSSVKFSIYIFKEKYNIQANNINLKVLSMIPCSDIFSTYTYYRQELHFYPQLQFSFIFHSSIKLIFHTTRNIYFIYSVGLSRIHYHSHTTI